MKTRMIDVDEIRNKYLPHRAPFLFVDKVLSFDDMSIKALKNVTYNEPYFVGHFPNYPVMPGVIIIEALAQTAGMLAKLKIEDRGDELNAYSSIFFTTIDGVKFKKPVRPGDTLTLEATYIKEKLGIWWFDCKASVDGELACVATLSAILKA